ncbi:chemosensory receptor B [Elysia marginata]|uniref:Chemosensory receptor B n=1 Tax=Elysia marginata TaxID=1093978 RepID=A0AAV4HXL6_9GAST|nr:chemosensory receptor B [Elysia marginata]
MSDLVYIILIAPTACAYVIYTLAKPASWTFDTLNLFLILYWPAYTVYDLSNYIAVTLGVMRCACVAMPLKFKLVFTKARTYWWLFFLVAVAIALRIPVLTVHRISYRTDPETNISSAYLESVNIDSMYQILDIMNRGIVINLSYTIMVACVAILSFKLYQASKVRKSYVAEKHQTSDKPGVEGLSPKELQAVKSVVLVCSIFVIFQLPFVLTAAARLSNPQIGLMKNLDYLFGIFRNVNVTCAYLNASINIFVYYNYNSKYRSVLCTWLRVKQIH